MMVGVHFGDGWSGLVMVALEFVLVIVGVCFGDVWSVTVMV